jgi:hypothetical protein
MIALSRKFTVLGSWNENRLVPYGEEGVSVSCMIPWHLLFSSTVNKCVWQEYRLRKYDFFPWWKWIFGTTCLNIRCNLLPKYIYIQISSLRSFHLLPVYTIAYQALHKDIMGNLTERVKGFPYVYSLSECYGVRNFVHTKENKFLLKMIIRC